MIEWRNGYGRGRWQPVRCDGAKLCYVGHMYYYTVDWSLTAFDYDPKVFRLRWMASLRGRIGTWAYKRATLKQISPVKQEAS